MQDRQPGAPGQYKATVTAAELQKLQAGEQFTITMVRDDQPIVEGTPYSKAAVLPDALAAIVCPDALNPTPADAIAALLPRNGKAAMTNNLPMGGFKVTGLGTPEADGDAVPLGYANENFAPAVESAEYPGCYYRTVNGVVEWVNPPMVPGVEYRTTERWNGAAVYTKLINIGTLPDTASGSLDIGVDASQIFDVNGIAKAAKYTEHLNLFTASAGNAGFTWWASGTVFHFRTLKNLSAYTGTITIKYTKD